MAEKNGAESQANSLPHQIVDPIHIEEVEKFLVPLGLTPLPLLNRFYLCYYHDRRQWCMYLEEHRKKKLKDILKMDRGGLYHQVVFDFEGGKGVSVNVKYVGDVSAEFPKEEKYTKTAASQKYTRDLQVLNLATE